MVTYIEIASELDENGRDLDLIVRTGDMEWGATLGVDERVVSTVL